MNVGKLVGKNKEYGKYFEVNAVVQWGASGTAGGDYVWTAGLRRTGNNTGEEVLCFLEFGDVFPSGPKQNRVSVVEARANESTHNHFGHVFGVSAWNFEIRFLCFCRHSA